MLPFTAEQEARFFSRVWVAENGCWEWQGHKIRGYGRFELKSDEPQATIAAHKFSYLSSVGPYGEGLHLDHVCRNRACVNPTHLEPVTAAENLRRSDVALGFRSVATHCVNGHEFTAENTYIRTTGCRACRECKRLYDRRVYAERKRELAGTGG